MHPAGGMLTHIHFLLRIQQNMPSINNINHGFTKACGHFANTKISIHRRFIHQVHDSSWAEGFGRHGF
jgi:Na+-transporting NADH:ubiquinone oxidoreductase subunit NqrA